MSLSWLVAVLPVDLLTPRIKLFPSYTSDLGLDGITSWGVRTVEKQVFDMRQMSVSADL